MRKLLLLLMTGLMLGAAPALAGDDDTESGGAGEQDRHDESERETEGLNELLKARRSGEILPLFVILSMVRPITGNDIVDIEFEREGGLLKYGIYFLDASGARREVYVDAKTGDVLEIKAAD